MRSYRCDNCLITFKCELTTGDNPDESLPVGLAIVKLFQTLNNNYNHHTSSSVLALMEKELRVCGGCGELLTHLLNSTLTLFKLMKEGSTLEKLIKELRRNDTRGRSSVGGVIKEEDDVDMDVEECEILTPVKKQFKAKGNLKELTKNNGKDADDLLEKAMGIIVEKDKGPSILVSKMNEDEGLPPEVGNDETITSCNNDPDDNNDCYEPPPSDSENDSSSDDTDYEGEVTKPNKGRLKSTPPSSSSSTYPCTLCPRIFKSLHGFNTHQQDHAEEGRLYPSGVTRKVNPKPPPKIPCPHPGCKAMFPPGQMKQHQISHTDERNYLCDHCGKAYKTVKNLKIHKRSHSGVKKYPCPYPGCGKGYNRNNDGLKYHILAAHEFKDPVICPTCGKQFICDKNLKTHMISHDEEKSRELLWCGVCDKMFSTPNNLRQHNRGVHQGVKVKKKRDDEGGGVSKRNFVSKLLRGENVYKV